MTMQSGDEAVMSADGYVSITGRIKDLIIRGGENIHPLEIENCLFANPGVLSVSVVGVPDGRYGEVVAAFVVPREEGQKQIAVPEIKEWVREKLSHHLGKTSQPASSISRFLFPPGVRLDLSRVTFLNQQGIACCFKAWLRLDH